MVANEKFRDVVDKPLAYFFARKVGRTLPGRYAMHDKFGLFIVLPLHRESLRDMMNKGRVNTDVKISVLKMLKPVVTEDFYSHGDLKDIFESIF